MEAEGERHIGRPFAGGLGLKVCDAHAEFQLRLTDAEPDVAAGGKIGQPVRFSTRERTGAENREFLGRRGAGDQEGSAAAERFGVCGSTAIAELRADMPLRDGEAVVKAYSSLAAPFDTPDVGGIAEPYVAASSRKGAALDPY
jgi:hypothetical protein